MSTPDTDMDLQSLILVVDDDPDLRKLITEFLCGHGYRVMAAQNGGRFAGDGFPAGLQGLKRWSL